MSWCWCQWRYSRWIIYLDEDIDDESDFYDSDRIMLYLSHILQFFKMLFNLLLDLFNNCSIEILDPKNLHLDIKIVTISRKHSELQIIQIFLLAAIL